jgi:hypothetical protein
LWLPQVGVITAGSYENAFRDDAVVWEVGRASEEAGHNR